MNIKTLGIDLAKNVFQVCGLDKQGKVVLKKRLSREKLTDFVCRLTPCRIGFEACGSAHYWARTFQSMSHTIKIMAPQFVKPYVKSNKNDRNDAEAIAEAVNRPTMRFVPIKGIHQQEIQSLHRARSLLIKQRTSLSNHIRGTLQEFGIIIPKGVSYVRTLLSEVRENQNNGLPELMRPLLCQLQEQFRVLDQHIQFCDERVEDLAKREEACQRLQAIEGIGPLTATALYAAVGNAKEFKNGREMAAWLGIVPKQHSSGDKTRLLGISKRGDSYLRTLLIHGARSVIRTCGRKKDSRSLWLQDKLTKGGENKVAVALANKNARIAWALLAKGERYRKAA